MAKNYLEIIREAKAGLMKEIESDWAKLNEKISQATQIDPDYVPPWHSKNTGDCRMIGLKSLKEIIVDLLSENPEQRLSAAKIGEVLKKRGSKKYTYNYIYNTLWYLVTKNEEVNSFVVKKVHPDGERPSYFKMKAKRNAAIGVEV